MNIKLMKLVLFISLTQVLIACAGSPVSSTPTPAVQTTPTNDPSEAAKVVQAFWDAVGQGDLVKAMTYVGDDVTCTGLCHFSGKELFETFFKGYLRAGYITKISNVKNVGGIVTYSWDVSRNGIYLRGGVEDEIMEVEEGKIIYWENNHR